MQSRSYTKAEIREKLGTSVQWAMRGAKVLYQRQTQTEQAMGITIDRNRQGFSGWDAAILTDFVQLVERGHSLSQKQVAVLLRRMPKYAGQLWKVAYEEQQAA